MQKARRLARNESLFREVNENSRSLVNGERDGDICECICECSDLACTATVRLTKAEYEAARADGTRFVLAPGHERDDIERVVKATARYVLVEKIGQSGSEAAGLDPRAR